MARKRRHFAYGPNGEPRYIRVYDAGPENYIDRYDVAFLRIRDGRRYISCLTESGASSHHADYPINQKLHLGKPIAFDDLPELGKRLILREYADVWGPFEGGQDD